MVPSKTYFTSGRDQLRPCQRETSVILAQKQQLGRPSSDSCIPIVHLKVALNCKSALRLLSISLWHFQLYNTLWQASSSLQTTKIILQKFGLYYADFIHICRDMLPTKLVRQRNYAYDCWVIQFKIKTPRKLRTFLIIDRNLSSIYDWRRRGNFEHDP